MLKYISVAVIWFILGTAVGSMGMRIYDEHLLERYCPYC